MRLNKILLLEQGLIFHIAILAVLTYSGETGKLLSVLSYESDSSSQRAILVKEKAPVKEKAEIKADKTPNEVSSQNFAQNEQLDLGFNHSNPKLSNEEYEKIKSISYEFTSADLQLTEAYSKLRKILNPAQKEQLKTEQIAWLKQRNERGYEVDKKGAKSTSKH